MEITVPIMSALGPEQDYYEPSKLRQREIEIWLQRVDEQTRLMKTQGRHETFEVSEKQDITHCAAFADHFKKKGNKFTDSDGMVLTEIITKNTTLKCLYLNHNQFREAAGKSIGKAIGENDTLEELELSWNHLRQQGAVGFARGIEKNRSLKRIDLSWNGFAFEGCVAIADALVRNIVLEDLDLSSNRIHPPAVLELMRGLTHNKTLKILHLSRNPMTPPFVTILLEGIKKSPMMALEQLIMEGIVVDRDFDGILKSIQSERHFLVTYEMSLPVSGKKRNDLLKDVTTRNAYNIEPLRLLYLLKEKNRAQDFFHKINKDNNDCLTRDELYLLFKEAGIPVTQMVIDRIMKFMDKDKDGTIDLGEFLQGDKKIKKISRDQARNSLRIGEEAHYTRYSRTFRNAHIEPVTSRLKVDEGPKYLSPIVSRDSSPNSSRRSSIGFDLQ